ncbi:MAG: hypothetical protein R3264_12305 [Anaerolineae bacterium]|nr:hypothetical protein [Anaerolineae bacterium]
MGYSRSDQESRLGSCLLWFFGLGSLSFMAVCSLALFVLVLASMALNVYLGYQLSGVQIAINIPTPGSTVLAATPESEGIALVPTATATVDESAETEFAPPEATADDAVAAASTPTPVDTPTDLNAEPSAAEPAEEIQEAGSPAEPDAEASPTAEAEADENTSVAALSASDNQYELIPLSGQRSTTPPDEDGDLNLALREPTPIDIDLGLVDIDEAGIDPDAPNLGNIFSADFLAAYAVHEWDHSCPCVGNLIEDGKAILVGIDTTPGDLVRIPTRDEDIYQGKFVAVLLYASEDSVAFSYSREGTVANGYTIHYLGLETDPNLLALYRNSDGNELPGLTVDSPLGIATDELIVAVRDNGTFLDARSRKDWWD